MSLEERILTLLHEKIGFNPESIGSDKVLASVRATISHKQIDDPDVFLNGLRSGNAEFYRIVDAVVIPETWFFRDGAPFEFLKNHVTSERLPRPGDVLRCLSLPCSTGEEPYSIAMALLDAGLAPGQFSVDAVDISSQSLERAAAGHYGQYSFRSSDLAFRDRYFERGERGYTLNSNVRTSVRFSKGNLLDPFFANDRPHYDIVFCRNLLIYFDATGWAQATRTLQQLLKDTGLLFMGHAELLDMGATQFESIRAPLAFAYRKRIAKPTESPVLMKAAARTAGAHKSRSRHAAVKPARGGKITQHKPRKEAPQPQTIDQQLDQAMRLADLGEFAQAGEICRRCLAEHPASARSYFLLGLIVEAEGNAADAEQHYRRALYLDSRHRESMVHLALLLEGRGDTVGAANLRKRARDANHAK
jgi:chemotaxis protein methyltransferase WspC